MIFPITTSNRVQSTKSVKNFQSNLKKSVHNKDSFFYNRQSQNSINKNDFQGIYEQGNEEINEIWFKGYKPSEKTESFYNMKIDMNPAWVGGD